MTALLESQVNVLQVVQVLFPPFNHLTSVRQEAVVLIPARCSLRHATVSRYVELLVERPCFLRNPEQLLFLYFPVSWWRYFSEGGESARFQFCLYPSAFWRASCCSITLLVLRISPPLSIND